MTDGLTLNAGKAWLRQRLERGAHPLDGLDPAAARPTIDALTGLDPEGRTAAWGALADDCAARAREAGERSVQHEMWCQGYQAGFMGRYPVPNHPLKAQQYDRAREFFLNATSTREPPIGGHRNTVRRQSGRRGPAPLLFDMAGGGGQTPGGDAVGGHRHVEGRDARAPRRCTP